MRVWIGGVETLLPARWFFCPPDALPFPGAHGCEASPWLKDNEVNDDWGEVAGKKILDRGINPGYLGQCNVGDPQWFVDGQLPADFATFRPAVLTPCCGHIPPPNSDPRCPQPPVTCMPYYYYDPPKRVTLLTPSGEAGRFVYPTAYIYDFAILFPYPYYEVFINTSGSPPPPGGCLGSNQILEFYFYYHDFVANLDFGFNLTFISYDPVTMIGVFNVPLASPIWGGEDLYFQYHPLG